MKIKPGHGFDGSDKRATLGTSLSQFPWDGSWQTTTSLGCNLARTSLAQNSVNRRSADLEAFRYITRGDTLGLELRDFGTLAAGGGHATTKFAFFTCLRDPNLLAF